MDALLHYIIYTDDKRYTMKEEIKSNQIKSKIKFIKFKPSGIPISEFLGNNTFQVVPSSLQRSSHLLRSSKLLPATPFPSNKADGTTTK
jgi:hypothetical protein